MFSNRSIALTKELEEAEKDSAVMQFGKIFNTSHEGYAVLKEEIEEAAADIKEIENYLSDIWAVIKKDNQEGDLLQKLVLTALASEYLILEAAQIHAVTDKFIDTLKKEQKENE